MGIKNWVSPLEMPANGRQWFYFNPFSLRMWVNWYPPPGSFKTSPLPILKYVIHSIFLPLSFFHSPIHHFENSASHTHMIKNSNEISSPLSFKLGFKSLALPPFKITNRSLLSIDALAKCGHKCVCLCVCVCVRERERERVCVYECVCLIEKFVSEHFL